MFVAGVSSVALASAANATFIVDTGTPPNDIDITTWQTARYASDQFLGANFVLHGQSSITGIEGWMSVPPGGNGEGRISVYADQANALGTLLLSTVFHAAITDATEPLYNHAEWLGASGLAWELAAGSYWVTFEADPGGVVAGFILGAPNQLRLEAFSQGEAQPWVRNDGLALGIRIAGNVPEPNELALTLLGLLLCACASRNGKRSFKRFIRLPTA